MMSNRLGYTDWRFTDHSSAVPDTIITDICLMVPPENIDEAIGLTSVDATSESISLVFSSETGVVARVMNAKPLTTVRLSCADGYYGTCSLGAVNSPVKISLDSPNDARVSPLYITAVTRYNNTDGVLRVNQDGQVTEYSLVDRVLLVTDKRVSATVSDGICSLSMTAEGVASQRQYTESAQTKYPLKTVNNILPDAEGNLFVNIVYGNKLLPVEAGEGDENIPNNSVYIQANDSDDGYEIKQSNIIEKVFRDSARTATRSRPLDILFDMDKFTTEHVIAFDDCSLNGDYDVLPE